MSRKSKRLWARVKQAKSVPSLMLEVQRLQNMLQESRRRECSDFIHGVIIEVNSDDCRYYPQYQCNVRFQPEAFVRAIHRQSRGDFYSINAAASEIGYKIGRDVQKVIVDELTKSGVMLH